MLSRLSKVIQNVGVVATAFFECVSEYGHSVKGSFIVDGMGDGNDGGGEPGGVDGGGAEGVAEDAAK
jgi:hypothetical protein